MSNWEFGVRATELDWFMTVWALVETPNLDESPLVDFLVRQGDLLVERSTALPDDRAITSELAFGSLSTVFLIESTGARSSNDSKELP